MSLDPIFIYANYAEACLWAGLAVIVVIKCQGQARWMMAVALLLFGLSDVIETRTGAWYKPWWLFAWKALCVLCILASGIFMLRQRASKGRQPGREQPRSGAAVHR